MGHVERVGPEGHLWFRAVDNSQWVKWHPHSDANQALEVWMVYPRMWGSDCLTWSIEQSVWDRNGQVHIFGCHHSGGINRIYIIDSCGDFCTAICRAFLKVRRLVEANDTTVLDVQVGDPIAPL